MNPDCEKPINQDVDKYCQSCGTELIFRLRNRFIIIQPLGRGGFGKTYLAEDTDKLKEKCVVKQLVYQAQGPTANKVIIDLFMREAEQLQQLWANPQIPSLFAYFEEGGYLYLVQQYVEGQDLLKELQEEGCFNGQKIEELLKDLLPVFEAIHMRKVIHRDVKPENIMRRGSDGRLILIDFGVSKQLSKSIASIAGTMVGSLGYAAPEQMESGIAQPSSDLYSLGASCFHLMTGINPWSLWKMQGYGWLNEWRQHLQQPIGSELGEILDQLLQVQAKDRYQSATAVLSDLDIQLKEKLQSTSQLPHRGRRQILLWLGLGLGSVFAYERIRNSSKSNDFETEPSIEPGSEDLSSMPEPLSPDPPSPTLESTSEIPLETFSFEVVTVDIQGEVIDRIPKQSKFFRQDLGNGTTLDMVAMPGGKFLMGSPSSELERQGNEGPQHEVTVAAFYMGKYEVTQAQWEEIMGSNPSSFQGANRPVENISWDEAVRFCQELSQQSGKDYRLPSEAEWEYACRAGTNTPFSNGETITSELANYKSSLTYGSGPTGYYRQQSVEVGSFPPNAFGLYDMHGNVSELCQDTFQLYSTAPKDGSARVNTESNRNRIVRGGSWVHDPQICRSAVRFVISPDKGLTTNGFRLALSVKFAS
ncbi:SUMF1/EgtB/PvdO family nonheme iron enzyme [Acaryochloris marina NIES-2412]|uniref:SUMF1/EgtB/PvdO family nonheme iron enzyme n=1 Tax=Acaryochloris marina TaxID=155978 RepID=UPI004057FECF